MPRRAGGRERLDQLLVERGLAPNRSRAQALILAGRVRTSDRRLDKPGERVACDLPVEVEAGRVWVGRGADKLEGTLERLGVAPCGRDCLDVGASTGGFTQVLLARGARQVVALDVGRGQLDWTLRRDPRVVTLEGRNARELTPADLPGAPSLAVVDVSFISLTLVLPAIVACLSPGGEVVALVKPQFEAGRERVGRGGVVRDPSVWRDVLARIADLARDRGWRLAGAVASPLPGAEGNREFFVHLRPDEPPATSEADRAHLDAALAEAER